uniref:Mlo4 n=1 Tax=Arundo donax TaxID=35708 RepID=A0A0A9EMK2_ARUDO
MFELLWFCSSTQVCTDEEQPANNRQLGCSRLLMFHTVPFLPFGSGYLYNIPVQQRFFPVSHSATLGPGRRNIAIMSLHSSITDAARCDLVAAKPDRALDIRNLRAIVSLHQ